MNAKQLIRFIERNYFYIDFYDLKTRLKTDHHLALRLYKHDLVIDVSSWNQDIYVMNYKKCRGYKISLREFLKHCTYKTYNTFISSIRQFAIDTNSGII